MAEPLTLLGAEQKEADAPWRLWWLAILALSLILWSGVGFAAAALFRYFG
jgi:hypothetical protein